MSTLRTALFFDRRVPAFGVSASELYAAALEMSAFADRIGVTKLCFNEHHGCEDGYLANPFLMGAAAEVVTLRIRIRIRIHLNYMFA